MTDQANGQEAKGDLSVGRRTDRLPDTVAALGGPEESRRDVLLEQAEERGLRRPVAEQAYDIAREVGLDPVYGIALVLEGISVRPLSSPRPDVDTSDPNEPEWVDAPPDPALAERERRLRQTFRRLRSHFDEEAGAKGAIRALAAEPDLEPYAY